MLVILTFLSHFTMYSFVIVRRWSLASLDRFVVSLVELSFLNALLHVSRVDFGQEN